MILLVIDTQKGITDDRLYAFDQLKKNISLLIDEARKNGVEVVYVRHDDGEGSGFSAGDGDFEIYDGFRPHPGERIFDKRVNNAFSHRSGLLTYLQNTGVKKIITVGLQTDYCMDATIKSGMDHGFEMIVPEYCNSTRSNDYFDAETIYRSYNESMWPGRYAACISVDDTVKMIREYVPSGDKPYLMPCETKDYESERLMMRKFSYGDIDSMMRNWISDDDVQNKYGEPAYKTREEVKALLDAFIYRYQSGYGFRWAIIEKSSGECIGQIAYFLVDAKSGFGEIEYCIGRAYQGRGYATEATRAVIDHGFDVIGFNKVQICVRPANTPSQKVIDKCGFKYDGTLRDYFMIDGEHQDRKYYSILKTER